MFDFNAQGDTFTLTKLFALSTLVNLILDPVFIFDWGGFPELGISGAATATLFSQFVFIVIALYSLSRPKRSVRFHFRNLGFHWQSVKEVMRIGFPAALTQILNPIGLAILTYMVSTRFLEPGAIAFSLGFRVEFFAYLPAFGYGFAAMAMMGRSIGAHDLKRAKDVLKRTLLYGGGIALALGLVVFVFAPQIIAIFTNESAVIGRSWPGFWITFVRMIVVTAPLDYPLVFVLKYDIMSVWIATIAGNVISALLGYVWIKRTMDKFTFKKVDVAMESN